MFHNNLTDRMKQYLATQGVPEAKVNEVFVALTHPRSISLIQKEREDFLHIAFAIQKNAKQKKLFADIYSTFLNKEAGPYGWQTHTEEFEHGLEQRADQLIDAISPEILKRIQKHYASYFYVPRMWIGETAHFTYYLKELVKLIGQKSDIAALLKEEKKKLQTANSLRERYLRQYRISGKWKTLFLAFGDFMVTKIYRRFAQIYALYKMEFLQKEIARRLHISLKEMRFMLPKEVHAALTRGHLSRSMLKQRVKECVYISEKNRDTILVGAAAKRMKKQLQSMKHESSEELHGQTGCVGKATGRVKIIIRPKDMAKMQRGDILVSIATDPDIVAAMKKAAAIVTEQGGVTSHAAIVSRELKIPCVIGTKIATKVLKDGDQVEVDATKGIVRKL
ncbi:MAG: hypothetical protein H6760_04225 [Candidatus Nomurabacteria bacterium]|nr:MAG: hypothetical protein H6760_04225 [Candidatus Nomurabacteria bacterium]